jgi:hypothetical protein
MSSPGFFPPRRLFVLVLVLLGAAAAPARDVYVLLSGGGTPLTNNYSQYLQAREMTAHLQRTYPADSVWVFFGVGNRPGEAAKLADVRKQVKETGFIRETWLPGPLPHNRPARKADFLKALREEILPAVHDGGTLYLFIGDHGSLAKKGPKESVVTMWQLENPDGKERSWRTNPDEELSVTDLRNALDAGLGRGRVVFCMTQCHSGGFHYLGVPRALLPPTEWFTAVPDWAMPVDRMPLPLAAGFTAVDEESLAAGCDPDPDPDRWAGYERFVPEALLGVDMFTGRIERPGLPSYAAAHEASVLVDQTIDKPRSSSEQYLERWAGVVEKLSNETSLTPEVAQAVAAYRRAVDGGLAEATDAAFATKRALFERYVQRMTEQNKSAATLMQTGTRAELERAVGPRPPAGGGQARRPAPTSTAANTPPPPNAWKDTIRPAWKAAVEAKKVKGLKGDALAFEKRLLEAEDKGRELLFVRGWQNPILNDIFWASGYAFPAKLDKKKAEAVSRWGATRREKIGEWARASADPLVKAAAGKAFPERRNPGAAANPPPRTLSTKIAAERTLFYRRTLAAWEFLLAVKAEPALAELHQLIELENTPMATPARRS